MRSRILGSSRESTMWPATATVSVAMARIMPRHPRSCSHIRRGHTRSECKFVFGGRSGTVGAAMGQIVNVAERPSSRRGIVRFETNRALSGMGHDRFVAGEPIEDVRPVDELARRIFARGGINAIHINGSVITVDLAKGYTAEGIADIIRGLYT